MLLWFRWSENPGQLSLTESCKQNYTNVSFHFKIKIDEVLSLNVLVKLHSLLKKHHMIQHITKLNDDRFNDRPLRSEICFAPDINNAYFSKDCRHLFGKLLL